MSTTTFDKLVYVESLKAAGIPDDQARAHAIALEDALRDSVATKGDVKDVTAAVELARRDLKIWTASMAGVVIALSFGNQVLRALNPAV